MKKIIFTLLCLVLFKNVVAQEHLTNTDKPEQHKENHFHTNHITLFNGFTSNFKHKTTDYTLGLDYEYRISNLFGIGLVGEYVFTKEGEFIVGIPGFIHPVKGLRFTVMPFLINNKEHHESHSGSHSHTASKAERKWQGGVRINANYDFYFGNFTVGPALGFDFSKTNSMIYGIDVGIGF